MAKKVLVLDDDNAVLEAVETALIYEDFEVNAIDQTEDIFRSISDYNPDIVLLDFILGGLSGGEICRSIKSNPATRHLPVVIISAYQGNIEALESFGCDHFIPKPFSLIDLIDGVNSALKKAVAH